MRIEPLPPILLVVDGHLNARQGIETLQFGSKQGTAVIPSSFYITIFLFYLSLITPNTAHQSVQNQTIGQLKMPFNITYEDNWFKNHI